MVLDNATAYFITTDRISADASFSSLVTQSFPKQPVIVRNITPMSSAYARVLECCTKYAFVLDDDVILNRNSVASELVTELDEVSGRTPSVFWLAPRVIDELTGDELRGGVKVFVVPLLRRIGFPDTPHISFGQRVLAEAAGLVWLKSERVVGTHMMGSIIDVYQRYLWLQIRSVAREGRSPDLGKLLDRAKQRDRDVDWIACLGVLDGMRLKNQVHSKGKSLRGPSSAWLEIFAGNRLALRRRVQEIVAAWQQGL